MNKSPILIADDNQDDVFFLTRSLQAASIENEIVVAHSVREAFACLRSQAGQAYPCLLLLDFKLFSAGGLEVLRWVRRSCPFPSLPVIMYSGSMNRKDIEQSYALGATAFVAKESFEDTKRLAIAIREFWLRFVQLPYGESG